jgi:transposase
VIPFLELFPTSLVLFGMSTLPLNTDITTAGPHTVQRTFINPSLWFDDCDGYRVFFCRHEILYRVALHNSIHLKIIAVTLRQSRLATQQDIATAFGHTVATQRRWEKLYAQFGSAAFTPKPHTGRRPSIDVSQHALVRRWFLEHLSTAEIARRLGVDEATVRRLLRRLGLSRTTPSATLFPPPLQHVTQDQTSPEAPVPAAPEVSPPPVLSPGRCASAAPALTALTEPLPADNPTSAPPQTETPGSFPLGFTVDPTFRTSSLHFI